MRLGLDSYSLRWQGWNAHQFLDYAAKLGLDNVQFSERSNLTSHDADYLRDLKAYADKLGLTIEVGMGSFDRYAASFRPEYGSGEEQLTAMLHVAAAVGSPVVRCFLGAQDERSGAVALREHIAECVRTLRAVAPLVRELGIKIAVENHGGVDLLARELRDLIETVGTETVGVCLDTGNPPYAAEDPLLSTAILAPYTITTHLRDTKVWATEDGAAAQWVPLGAGSADLPAILALLAEHAPGIAINLEVITGTPPASLPYLTPDAPFWERYPDMLARDFARYVALARRGTPGAFEQQLLPSGLRLPPEDQLDAYREQQRQHFEQSVRHAREVLGLGERDKAPTA
jgi:sugar phosphate isomerase/epimerase